MFWNFRNFGAMEAPQMRPTGPTLPGSTGHQDFVCRVFVLSDLMFMNII